MIVPFLFAFWVLNALEIIKKILKIKTYIQPESSIK